MCFGWDESMEHNQGVKYYITRRKGTGGLYLATNPYISKREVKPASGRQGLPSSVFIETPKSSPQFQQESPRSSPEFRHLANETQPSLGGAGGNTGHSGLISKDNRRCKESDTRRVRFSIPEEADVVYPGNQENLRILREQFDGISANDGCESPPLSEDWWAVDFRHRPAESSCFKEQALERQQEMRPRGILKNRGSKILETCGSTCKEPNQAPKSFFYSYSSQNYGVGRKNYLPVRRLRILYPPPLPEIRTLYGSGDGTGPTKRHVRFDKGRDKDENTDPIWDIPVPIPPVQRQVVSYPTRGVSQEPMKPIPAYVRSEEEEARGSVVAW